MSNAWLREINDPLQKVSVKHTIQIIQITEFKKTLLISKKYQNDSPYQA